MNRNERYYVNEEYLDDDDLPNHIVEGDDDLPNHIVEGDDDEQEGGWKGRGSWKNQYRQEDYFGYPARELRTSDSRKRNVYQKGEPKSWVGDRLERVVYSDRTGVSVNAYRTYRAMVDGKMLVGEHNAPGSKTRGGKPKRFAKNQESPPPIRYFHGSPLGAARKVIGSMYKRKEIGENDPVKIELIEVTKGYRPAKGGYFKYQYWGQREPLTDDDFRKKKDTMKRDGEPMAVTGKNTVVPARGFDSFDDALIASKEKGMRIKEGKIVAQSVSAEDKREKALGLAEERAQLKKIALAKAREKAQKRRGAYPAPEPAPEPESEQAPTSR